MVEMLFFSQKHFALVEEHVLLASTAVLLSIATIFQLAKYLSHPLRHIPGPFLSTISQISLFYESLRGRRVHWIMKQHERHGPVIRIAPDKICVATEEGIKQIYSNKTSKSHAYDAFRYKDVKMCIGLLDVKLAHARRKGLLPAFSRQNLMEMEPVIRVHLELFLTLLQNFGRMGQAVDVFKWFRHLTFDVVTDITFGQKIGMLASGDSHFIEQVEHRNKRNGLVGYNLGIQTTKVLH